jgi:predicted transcriptional regulator YdeE
MLKIGEFAQQTEVSVKTLHHYDRLGLLKPAWKDRFSGYRYYRADQVPDLKRILTLKDLGFSLEQILTILQEDLTMPQLRTMLRLKRTELLEEIEVSRARLAQIETQLAWIDSASSEGILQPDVLFPVKPELTAEPTQDKECKTMQVKIEKKPAFTVAGMEYVGKNENQEIAAMWANDWPHINALPHKADPDVCYGVCGDMDEDNSFRYVAGFEVSQTKDLPTGMVSWEIPAQTYAVFPCTLETIHKTYEYAHGTWMPENDYKRADGPDFELYDETFDPEFPASILYVYIPIKK